MLVRAGELIYRYGPAAEEALQSGLGGSRLELPSAYRQHLGQIHLLALIESLAQLGKHLLALPEILLPDLFGDERKAPFVEFVAVHRPIEDIVHLAV